MVDVEVIAEGVRDEVSQVLEVPAKCDDAAISGREEEEAADGGRVRSLKNPGAGKKTASVFDALMALPTCISRLNFANYRRTTAEPISNSLRDGNANAQSSTYSMQKMSERVPSEKVLLLWLV
eukprot:CAMPEP_0194333230 /NCGR_PEP_ID=MMETSP0171-20130528/62018_1 /TAXON_ID=218684 /ORGANISM="Corethron pennatum, Strain L29A3" /LENGTH=122 /DNA_ID=CAMNT_0039095379 /DNA_START=200 /DNA_END=564 /DNA_ORIENTATION=-